jgi:hypothetical protein
MINFTKFEGKLIRLNKEYPIYNEGDEVIGYTSAGDMAVITLAEINRKTSYKNIETISEDFAVGVPIKTEDEDGYFETVIVSGKYIGVDTLALNLSDIREVTFIFNKISEKMESKVKNETDYSEVFGMEL